MLKEKMYVRCPMDDESEADPRIFMCGQIKKIDEYANTASVKFYDPFQFSLFFDDVPKDILQFPMDQIEHCRAFPGSEISVGGKICSVLSVKKTEDEFFEYYVQDLEEKEIFRVSEQNISVPFINGEIDPDVQLMNYEFQHPCWYFGFAVVSRSMNALENSSYGFKELAGSKIYLLPHQVNTIMRCLSEPSCRFMLADEVGMGKTVEAVSILKIYLQKYANQRALIIVPDSLKEQWKIELLLKFNISPDTVENNNRIFLKSISELSSEDISSHWDFVIVDEVHRYLPADQLQYESVHCISRQAANILLLSATPIQQRDEEYLDLLKLLQPEKYDYYELDYFKNLLDQQNQLIQNTALVLDDLDDLEGVKERLAEQEEDPHTSEDCSDLFTDIYDGLEKICTEINDEKLLTMLHDISFEDEDIGIQKIKILISYISGNYEIESNIIRNRRKLCEFNEDGTRLFPTRKLEELSYPLDKDQNRHEAYCYDLLSNWLTESGADLDFDSVVKPLSEAFFSSSWAFSSLLEQLKNRGIFIEPEVLEEADAWVKAEDRIVENISEIIDDPIKYEAEYCTRLVKLVEFLYEESDRGKAVVFTNYPETFSAYRSILSKFFPAERISFFGADLDASERELNAFRFQNDSDCRIMLCDYSGGEGRNFQCADYVVHIDLPWDANLIEQRIGRLDRLEREPSRSIVTSVVIHTEDSFEEALFNFWNEGLKIFTESLSGMEIIMKDINHEIEDAVREDFKYGLSQKIPQIIELSQEMRSAVKIEQIYDVAGMMYRPMFLSLKRMLDFYADNEDLLYSDTMVSWAQLAGFRGEQSENEPDVISYTKRLFNIGSAVKAQLIPPNWEKYLQSSQSQFISSVQNDYNKSKSFETQEQTIRGTFCRKLAIENDYLHFFAPGDDIFDCIVDNAMQSSKGRSSAFAAPADINWKGIVFTWSIAPNESYLLDHGISIYALGPYRNFISTSQIIVAISIDNPDSISEEKIVQSYKQIINTGYRNGRDINLGKRTLSPGFLRKIITGDSNIGWFKSQYPKDIWPDIVKNAKIDAREQAEEQIKNTVQIREVKEEMERSLSSRAANSALYGIKDEQIDDLKKEQEIILQALTEPVLSLDSAAYIWMVKVSSENGRIKNN